MEEMYWVELVADLGKEQIGAQELKIVPFWMFVGSLGK